MTTDLLEIVQSRLAGHGLILRGGFNFEENEDGPEGPSRCPARSMLLIGNGGGGIWPHFSRWLEDQRQVPANPLDTWSKQVLCAVAIEVKARAVFPSDKPWLPFQQWAGRAEGLKPSPLGILMHPDYGLWHAYRGALLFDDEISIQKPRNVIHHCDLCDGKPCISGCPVDAFSGAGYDVETCVTHVTGEEGETCREGGCLARNACPIASEHRYSMDQRAFHMAAFLRARAAR